MPELRWTLLVLGVGFLAALAWWELRRPRQAAHREHLNEPGVHAHSPPEPLAPEDRREPALGLPEIGVPEVARALPIVEIADDSMIGLRLDGQALEPVPVVLEEDAEAIVPTEPAEAESVSADAGADAYADAEPESEPVPPPTEMTADPIVEWPDEPSRRIVAIRIIAHMDRFPATPCARRSPPKASCSASSRFFTAPAPDGRALHERRRTQQARDVRSGFHRPATLRRTQSVHGTARPARRGSGVRRIARRRAQTSTSACSGALQDERGDPLTPVRAASIRDVAQRRTSMRRDAAARIAELRDRSANTTTATTCSMTRGAGRRVRQADERAQGARGRASGAHHARLPDAARERRAGRRLRRASRMPFPCSRSTTPSARRTCSGFDRRIHERLGAEGDHQLRRRAEARWPGGIADLSRGQLHRAATRGDGARART